MKTTEKLTALKQKLTALGSQKKEAYDVADKTADYSRVDKIQNEIESTYAEWKKLDDELSAAENARIMKQIGEE